MKKLLFFLSFLFLACLPVYSNGIAIVDATSGKCLPLAVSTVVVQVQNQIAITKTTQVFRNDLPTATKFKYGFPVPETATAVGLRWKIGGIWREADFKAEPQDTTLPGGGGGGNNAAAFIATYLGKNPLFFEIKTELPRDSSVAIELTYVDLLPYSKGQVKYHYPAQYDLVQKAPLALQEFKFELLSGRKITSLKMLSHPGDAAVSVDDKQATVALLLTEKPATANFTLEYALDASDLGLFGFSNFLADSLGCDNYGNGFCAFVVEPSPNPNAAVIPKVFTLIVDRSGSMYGEKMKQARDAASFIVNHLNPGDLFNVIDFDDQITSFKPDHVAYNPDTRDQALNYIKTLTADGSTNISGAFSAAIPQFANDKGDTYNIILFFTDGVPTAGITDPTGILNHVTNLIKVQEAKISIFTFGVGPDVNKPLLTKIANNNKGIAQFLDNNELESTVTEFYETVQNPVLLNTAMSISPNRIAETYPIQLPNLFKGSQMIVVGRYDTPGEVDITFSGSALGAPATYHYPLMLTGKDSVLWRFLPKLWAKQKAAHLQQLYYAATNPAEIESLAAQIKQLGICYGIITGLTSFVDPGNGGGVTSIAETPSRRRNAHDKVLDILSLTPNPATDLTRLQVEVKTEWSGELRIEMYDPLGRLVESFPYTVPGKGTYSIDLRINPLLPSGFYTVRVVGEIGTAARLLELK